MDDFDDDFAGEVEELDESERELQKLEERLENVRPPKSGGNKKFAQGVALVASLGFVFAGCLFGGVTVGEYLAEKTGSDGYELMGVLLGLGMALFSGVKLMQPLLKSDD